VAGRFRALSLRVHDALIETIHIATLGTLLSICARGSGRRSGRAQPGARGGRQSPCKLVLVSSRSVNSLVWALLFVGIFGPGALAGTLAIAFRSIGFVGKLFGEALEEAPSPDRSKRSPPQERRGCRE
jgi:phosphonate transport system permease protein